MDGSRARDQGGEPGGTARSTRRPWTRAAPALAAAACAATGTVACCCGTAEAQLGGSLPGPLPLFPPDNWWNLDISAAPVDPRSAGFIAFIGAGRGLHPDFGGDDTSTQFGIFGFPYAVVAGTQP